MGICEGIAVLNYGNHARYTRGIQADPAVLKRIWQKKDLSDAYCITPCLLWEFHAIKGVSFNQKSEIVPDRGEWSRNQRY